MEAFAPYGNGITVKLGRFYTIIGNEAISAPDRFFYSRATTSHYGEPATHTGFLVDYPLNHQFKLTGGGVFG